jgi:hypothetical protein
VLAGAAVRAVVVRVIDVSEAIGLELGEFHVATLPRPACGYPVRKISHRQLAVKRLVDAGLEGIREYSNQFRVKP